MNKIIFIITLFIFSIKLTAQNNTMGTVTNSEANGKAKVLIIPFEPRLYISDIDKELVKENQMNFQDIKAKFRAALDQNIYISLKKYYTSLSFYTIPQEDAIKELSYIYNSIGYKYEVMPVEEVVEKENTGKKLMNKFKKKEREEEPIEAGINNGQIVSQTDDREKYMMTKISNENLINTLNKQYQATYYLFINELDIKRTMKESGGMNSQSQREIKVHYTIFNNQEKVMDSGAIKTLFNSSENDIEKIIKSEFPLIADKLAEKIVNVKPE
ncbi:hypothetical protein FRY74_09555 [Vicingus serpentipes]|jgi:hypothetical protein|uniref:Uncharacterized protein n=1 Tax=Vicingus serpentipes TaxID=1926625 RepID=A0A5C6RR69_9FLAO|nr:hypothetical protein [Vicingus serpentipes]TXB64687.1 hypothetical protein FRY74_09555 [Vicingus serpentipes]